MMTLGPWGNPDWVRFAKYRHKAIGMRGDEIGFVSHFLGAGGVCLIGIAFGDGN